ncbi:hypothetical protein [Chromobacterium phragmitis]|uniref:hypothetical protein n=1 Tax=Chromobacterium phragmitis TaxID=2202141 RepID=UPI0011AE6C6F|nr:hypothetical protein [Chromobacterium phragmitis]
MAQPKQTTATTKPKDKNATAEHKEDVYVLVIGFEVNNPQVYRDVDVGKGVKRKVHHVLEDPGHTFMYLTKNLKITFFYSLGPQPGASTMQRAYGKGTPEYHIPGKTRLYRLIINESQYEKMLAKGKAYRADVLAGDRNYNILLNFTCARSARDIIAVGWSGVPKGESLVGKSATLSFDEVVNPYAFYEDIHNKYPDDEITLEPDEAQWQKIMADGNNPSKETPDPTLNPSSFKGK